MTGPWWWQTTGARHRVENVPFRTWRKSPLCASSCKSLLALHISSVSSKAPRLHQLFTARSSSGVGPRKPWTLLHSALIVHVDLTLAASERRDDDEVLLLFRTFVVFCSKWMKLWVWLLVYLCRCSWLERLLCCVLIVVRKAASQWPGKNWKHEYICSDGMLVA